MLFYYKELEEKTASTDLTRLYFRVHTLIQIFCTLFICFALNSDFSIDLLLNVSFKTFDSFGKHEPTKVLISLC